MPRAPLPRLTPGLVSASLAPPRLQAPEFDLFSVDTYQWDYRDANSGAAEVAQVQSAWATLQPLMQPRTRAMLVPGTFACSNLSAIGVQHPVLPGGTDRQTQNVLAKINGLYEWAARTPFVAGFAPWHFRNRTGNQAPGIACDMRLGAEAMPAVGELLRRIGASILANGTAAPRAAVVRAGAPVLVAETQQDILWYPLNSHTLTSGNGVAGTARAAAILVRAQTSPDVNTNTTDAAFASYDNGSTWAPLGPQGMQERICYGHPPGATASVMCLQSADHSQVDSGANATRGVATFLGSIWELSSSGRLTKRPGGAEVPVHFDYTAAGPLLPAGTFMTLFTDGVGAGDGEGGVLVPLLAAAQPNPPPGLTQACRQLVVATCPGVQVHGAGCHACLKRHAAAFASRSCPDATVAANYAYYCDPGTSLPNMVFASGDGLSFRYRSQVRDTRSPISGAVDSGDENALIRLGDGRLMMVLRYDYSNHIPSRNPLPTPGGGPAVSVGGLVQVMR